MLSSTAFVPANQTKASAFTIFCGNLSIHGPWSILAGPRLSQFVGDCAFCYWIRQSNVRQLWTQRVQVADQTCRDNHKGIILKSGLVRRQYAWHSIITCETVWDSKCFWLEDEFDKMTSVGSSEVIGNQIQASLMNSVYWQKVISGAIYLFRKINNIVKRSVGKDSTFVLWPMYHYVHGSDL